MKVLLVLALLSILSVVNGRKLVKNLLIKKLQKNYEN